MLLFFTLGFLLPIIFKTKLKTTILVLLCVSISIELLQLSIDVLTGIPNRVVDINDCILNIIGGTIGFLTYILIDKYFFSKLL
ncbi:MAG TPA: hypothetical protein DEP23_07215, partial [Ruminococcaceae bacterium]|nr:hypothetical protein [Oscillospiraceae bacterium]